MNTFQELYCMVSDERDKQLWVGPYELLSFVRDFIDKVFTPDEQKSVIPIREEPYELPLAIAVGYYILSNLVDHMGGEK